VSGYYVVLIGLFYVVNGTFQQPRWAYAAADYTALNDSAKI
jgi:hypothetical protein